MPDDEEPKNVQPKKEDGSDEKQEEEPHPALDRDGNPIMQSSHNNSEAAQVFAAHRRKVVPGAAEAFAIKRAKDEALILKLMGRRR